MINEEVSPEGVFLAGGGNFGFPGDYPMTNEDGDDVWSITVQVPNGFTAITLSPMGHAWTGAARKTLWDNRVQILSIGTIDCS